MKKLKNSIKRYKYQFDFARRVFKDNTFFQTYKISKEEGRKKYSRTEIISFLLVFTAGENYLEIGVRNPDDNFNKIKCKNKYSVDPGIEFKKNPDDLKAFVKRLDENIQEVNSDYEAKRYNSMTLNELVLNVAQPDLFHLWLSKKDKLGGQNKIPRLSNDRSYLEQLIKLNN